MNLVKDKVVIITGGTRGIGFETAKLFLENGAKVIIFGSRKATVEAALSKLKKDAFEVYGYYPDLNNQKQLMEIVAEIYEKYGHIDVLINNAGISDNRKIEDVSSDDFRKIMMVNVDGIFNLTKVVIEFMKKANYGVILNTSSFVSIYGQKSGVGYPTSKAAVNGLTKSLALELAPYNIRVNAVAPGIINTDMVASLPKEMIEPLIKEIPLGRIGEPRDIANAFLFLASDMASYISGVILPVTGLIKN